MFKPTVPFLALAAALAAVLGATGPAARAASPLAPHRALYEMRLDRAEAASGVVAAEGVMRYRVEDDCDGWAVENSSYLTIRYDEGDQVKSTWSFISWESKDGRSYRFRMENSRDGRVTEELKGTASLDANGGTAHFDLPEDRTIDLPRGAMFPMDHLKAMLIRAEAGERWLSKTVFDGVSLDNPYLVTMFAGSKRPTAAAALVAEFGLPIQPVWPLRMAFFPAGQKEELPEFEMEVDYRPDGIGGTIIQDFGDFSLLMKPKSIELLDKPDC